MTKAKLTTTQATVLRNLHEFHYRTWTSYRPSRLALERKGLIRLDESTGQYTRTECGMRYLAERMNAGRQS